MNLMAGEIEMQAASRAPPAPGMVWIPGGEFLMGSDQHYPEEAPAHRVRVYGFWMDCCTVTNAEFERFVEETGYVTLAEKPANPADYPGALPKLLSPSSTRGHDGAVSSARVARLSKARSATRCVGRSARIADFAVM